MSKELEKQEAILIDQNPSLRLIRTGYTNFRYKYEPLKLDKILGNLQTIHKKRPSIDTKHHKINTDRHYTTTRKDKAEAGKNAL